MLKLSSDKCNEQLMHLFCIFARCPFCYDGGFLSYVGGCTYRKAAQGAAKASATTIVTHITYIVLHIYEGGSMSRHCIWAVRKTQGSQQVLTFKANQWSASTLESS